MSGHSPGQTTAAGTSRRVQQTRSTSHQSRPSRSMAWVVDAHHGQRPMSELASRIAQNGLGELAAAGLRQRGGHDDVVWDPPLGDDGRDVGQDVVGRDRATLSENDVSDWTLAPAPTLRTQECPPRIAVSASSRALASIRVARSTRARDNGAGLVYGSRAQSEPQGPLSKIVREIPDRITAVQSRFSSAERRIRRGATSGRRRSG